MNNATKVLRRNPNNGRLTNCLIESLIGCLIGFLLCILRNLIRLL